MFSKSMDVGKSLATIGGSISQPEIPQLHLSAVQE